MLKKLEILNGVMTPEYDQYNNVYTVNVNNDVTKLEINYEVEENIEVNIYGNDLTAKDHSNVAIVLNDGEKEEMIKLYVYKENSSTAANLQDYFETIEVQNNNKMPDYIAPLIGSICFLIIIISFSLIFRKRKKKIKTI